MNTHKVDPTRQFLYIARRRFALSLFYCQLLCAPASFSQRTPTSFGMLSDLNLGFRPLDFATGVSSQRVEIAVLAVGQPAVHFYELAPSDRLAHLSTIRTRNTLKFVTSEDLDADGNSEYIGITSSGNAVCVLKRKGDGTLSETEIPIPYPVQTCVLTDLNNDRRKDILLFGKSTAGVLTLLGHANGEFKPGPTLLPEISVSDLVPRDINGDGIVDLLALNWLSNELTVFSGIGRLIYSEQIAVQLQAEPEYLAVTSVDRDRHFRVAVTLPEQKKIQVYSGNSLGDYRAMHAISLEEKPSGVQLVDLNDDNLWDIVTSTKNGIVVSLGSSQTSFSQPATFGAARSVVSWNVADLNRDGKNDCILLDRTSQRLICLLNAENSGKRNVTEYCVGTSPMGVVLADFDGNGKEDIGTVNFGSSTFSVLLNFGKGIFSGQMSFALPEKPIFVRPVSTSKSEHMIIASHPKDDKVSVVNLENDIHRSKAFSVPTGTGPFVVSAKKDSLGLKFLLRYRSSDNSYLLSLFEQISARQFVERSLRSTLPTRILALAVDEGIAPGSYELLFATNDRATRQTTVSHGVSGTGLEFKTTKPLFSFPDSTASIRFVYGGFVNEDPFKDVIVSLGSPRNAMAIWYGRSPSVTQDSIEWISGIQPYSDDTIILKDVDGDNAVDIILLDTVRSAVVVIYGKEGRRARQPRVVASADGAHSIRIAPLREGNVYDLVMSNPDRGTVSVIMDPFRR